MWEKGRWCYLWFCFDFFVRDCGVLENIWQFRNCIPWQPCFVCDLLWSLKMWRFDGIASVLFQICIAAHRSVKEECSFIFVVQESKLRLWVYFVVFLLKFIWYFLIESEWKNLNGTGIKSGYLVRVAVYQLS